MFGIIVITMINIKALWDDAKVLLSAKLQAISYEVWIDKLETVCFNGHTLVLLTGSLSSKTTIEKNYSKAILDAINEINPLITEIKIIVESQKDDCLKQQDFVLGTELVVNDAPKPVENNFNFNKKYTFSSFVVGKSNEIAVEAAQAVAEHPGERFNPLFIYGGVGLGKTHILHAIGNHIHEKFPAKKIMYITTEKFTNELIESIRKEKNTNRDFREKYRTVDVLMIDDIQFLAGKDYTQEALFHTFNDLYQNEKQIIISSDRKPIDISPLEERLRTRFQWGLLADIQAPDIETRMAILLKKAEAANFNLSNEVAQFIAENIKSNIRDMEGLLNKVIFYGQISGQRVTSVAVAKEALNDYLDIKTENIDAYDILNTTCKYFNVSSNDVVGKKKNKEIVEPRMIAIYLITELLSIPLVSIGNIFGGRDHTTIIHSRDKITELLKFDNKLKIQINDLKDMLYKR
ncbi:MAG: chromosomal replication initiator protein DnaA [Clostridia bacterium]